MVPKWAQRVLFALGAVGLFFAYAWFPFLTPGIWNAPDEMAAAFLIERVPELGGSYDVPAAYADALGGLVHPRSLLVVQGQLVPGMWLGLPWLLAFVDGITGLGTRAELVIPLVAVLAVLAWQSVVRKLFDSRVTGWVAAVLLAVHPGWWYFTARGLHPNVLFTACLIFGVAAWYVGVFHAWKRRAVVWQRTMVFLGGLSFGMALFVRANEGVWLIPLLFVVAWVARKRPFSDHALGVAGVILPLVLMAVLNTQIYGAPLLSGYLAASDPVPVSVQAEQVVEMPSPIVRAVFPFGVHELNIVRNVLQFHVGFFGLWSAFTVMALVLLAIRWDGFSAEQRRTYTRALVGWGLVSLYLFVVYGSWNLNDNPDPTAVTIGTSYIRYWLPITVGMTALAAYALTTVSARRTRKAQLALGAIWLAAFGYTGAVQTLYGADEGLVYVQQNLARFSEQRAWVLGQTNPEDLILVDRSDKIVFPERQVVYPLRSETTYAHLPRMVEVTSAQGAHVYYMGITLPESDLEHLRTVRLAPQGLDIEIVDSMDLLSLYRLIPLDT